MALPLPAPMLPGSRQNPEKITFVSMATFYLTLLPLNLENLALRIGYQPLHYIENNNGGIIINFETFSSIIGCAALNGFKLIIIKLNSNNSPI